MPKKLPQISIIVTTYNNPASLRLVLQAIAAQNTEITFEVIVADDGSTSETRLMLNEIQKQLPFQLQHIWQEDIGFRVAMIRNKAIAAATGNYVIFLDGDCVPQISFLARHIKLAENGWFVAGNRILLHDQFTKLVLQNNLPIYKWNLWQWLQAKLHGDINRFQPLLNLSLGYLRKLKTRSWQGAKTCNLAVWKKDLLAVNGFDESYSGWGAEDSDLVVRLIKHGTLRKDARFAITVLHLAHPEYNRDRVKTNYERLAATISSTQAWATKGLEQYVTR